MQLLLIVIVCHAQAMALSPDQCTPWVKPAADKCDIKNLQLDLTNNQVEMQNYYYASNMKKSWSTKKQCQEMFKDYKKRNCCALEGNTQQYGNICAGTNTFKTYAEGTGTVCINNNRRRAKNLFRCTCANGEVPTTFVDHDQKIQPGCKGKTDCQHICESCIEGYLLDSGKKCVAKKCTLPKISSEEADWYGDPVCKNGATILQKKDCKLMAKAGFDCLQPGKCGFNGTLPKLAKCRALTGGCVEKDWSFTPEDSPCTAGALPFTYDNYCNGKGTCVAPCDPRMRKIDGSCKCTVGFYFNTAEGKCKCDQSTVCSGKGVCTESEKDDNLQCDCFAGYYNSKDVKLKPKQVTLGQCTEQKLNDYCADIQSSKGWKCFPSIDRVGRGYNIVKGEWRSPAVALTLNPESDFVTSTGSTYKLADEVDVSPLKITTQQDTSERYKSFSEYQSTIKTKLKVGAEVPTAAVHANHEESASVGSTLSQAKYVMRSYRQRQVYQVSLDALKMEITPVLKKYLDSLPPGYGDNKPAYQKVITAVGTHIAIHLTLGGEIEQRGSISICKAKSVSKSELEQSASAKMKRQIGKKKSSGSGSASTEAGKSSGTAEEQEEIMEAMESSLVVKGGDASLISDQDAWSKSVVDNLEVISFDLLPVVDLIKDKEVRASFQEALDDYYKSNMATDVTVADASDSSICPPDLTTAPPEKLEVSDATGSVMGMLVMPFWFAVNNLLD